MDVDGPASAGRAGPLTPIVHSRYSLAVASQYVILSREAAAGGDGLAPIGPRGDIVNSLSRYNTAPDGGDEVLYGPGIRLDIPPGEDPVTQMLLTVIEEEIAWLVILRLAKAFSWKIVDMNTGRELNA